MINKELKKLSRRELVDIIYQMKKNEQQMQEEIASLQEALQDKRLRLSTAGSIAEAAGSITNIFSTAQMTADLYLHEISCMKADAERECTQMIDAANKAVAKIFSENEKQRAILDARYQAEYQRFQQLQADIQALEQAKQRESQEG